MEATQDIIQKSLEAKQFVENIRHNFEDFIDRAQQEVTSLRETLQVEVGGLRMSYQ